jgi:hypothetical protein
MVAPVPLSLLLCEHAWFDPKSMKHTLIGIFSTVSTSMFPITFDFAAYFAVTDGHGKMPFRLEFAHLDGEDPPLGCAKGNLIFQHPQQVIEQAFQFSNVRIPEPGSFSLRFFAGDAFLAERTLKFVDGLVAHSH